MAISSVPFALQNASHPAALFRQAVSSLFPTGGGVVEVADFNCTQTGTPSMAVTVAPGRIWIPGTSVANIAGTDFNTQGMYFALNNGNFTATITASSPSNPRIDVVYVGVNDSVYVGSTDNAVIGVITGVPSATPVTPAIPVNTSMLATVAVAANATSITNTNITNYLTLASGIQSMPLGEIAYTNTAATSVGLSSSAFMCDRVVVNLVQGRWYRAVYRVDEIVPTATNNGLAIAAVKSIVSDVSAAGTGLDTPYVVWTAPSSNSTATHVSLFTWRATATETVNIKATMNRVSGSALFNISNRVLTVDDMGYRF